jgi:hypothetical protein
MNIVPMASEVGVFPQVELFLRGKTLTSLNISIPGTFLKSFTERMTATIQKMIPSPEWARFSCISIKIMPANNKIAIAVFLKKFSTDTSFDRN